MKLFQNGQFKPTMACSSEKSSAADVVPKDLEAGVITVPTKTHVPSAKTTSTSPPQTQACMGPYERRNFCDPCHFPYSSSMCGTWTVCGLVAAFLIIIIGMVLGLSLLKRHGVHA